MTSAAHLQPAHIVDVLIAERAPRLSGGAAWPILQPALYGLLGYRKARAMADAIGQMDGMAALEHVARLLSVKVESYGLERIPAKGRLVAVSNHPTGIADGIAVYEALRPVRQDLAFFANADALRVSPRLDEVLIPVEWVEAKRTRERTRQTLICAKAAFEAERAIVVFPAGRLARRAPDGALCDPPWQPGALSLARKYGAAIIPLYLSGPWSTLFHLFDRLSPELRDITLFHELLNKKGQAFRLIVGQAIDPAVLPVDPAAAAEAVKTYVERVLPGDPDKAFA